MKTYRKSLVAFLLGCVVMPAQAQGDFSRFIKSQDEIDRNTRRENRVLKKMCLPIANKEAEIPGGLVLPEEEKLLCQ